MKVIIAGTRTLDDIELVKKAIEESGFEISEVVCGEARGVDKKGREWAELNNIPVASFEADWNNLDLPSHLVKEKINKYGKQYNALAGFNRNEEMAVYAGSTGGLIAITTGSPGTKDMIQRAENHGLDIFIMEVKK